MIFIRIPKLHPQMLTANGMITINAESIDAMFWTTHNTSRAGIGIGYTTILLRGGVEYYTSETEKGIMDRIEREIAK